MQVWAETSTKYVDIKSLLDEMIKSDVRQKMYQLYLHEASQRGHNKWALYSAFTNYASYADERNGFNLRNTGNDTQAISMWSVSKRYPSGYRQTFTVGSCLMVALPRFVQKRCHFRVTHRIASTHHRNLSMQVSCHVKN